MRRAGEIPPPFPKSRRSLSGLGVGVVQQTAFSCCPIKHCSHMLFAASLRLLQRPCPARQPTQQCSTAASEPCSFSSSLPRCHGDIRHLRAVRRLGNGGASAAPPGDPPLPLQPHSRALLVDGRGESRDRRAAGPRLDPEPSASASVTWGTLFADDYREGGRDIGTTLEASGQATFAPGKA